MREKMLEFVLKRLGGKITELKDYVDYDNNAADVITGDLDVYFNTLKELITELITP